MHLTPTAVGPPLGGATGSRAPEPLVLVEAGSSEDGIVIEEGGRSFDDFYTGARASIARALALSLGDVDLATDATDEALARAYERWPTVSRLDRPEGWVYRVAMNWALSILRRRRRGDHRLYDPGVDTTAISDPDVHAALAELDVKHRSVIVCRHLLGWSVADTAAALNVREGTVKSRLHRAHRILQSRLHHLRTPEEHS
jgi:RNA polymerase sigma factor (sigma-70 family)